MFQSLFLQIFLPHIHYSISFLFSSLPTYFLLLSISLSPYFYSNCSHTWVFPTVPYVIEALFIIFNLFFWVLQIEQFIWPILKFTEPFCYFQNAHKPFIKVFISDTELFSLRIFIWILFIVFIYWLRFPIWSLIIISFKVLNIFLIASLKSLFANFTTCFILGLIYTNCFISLLVTFHCFFMCLIILLVFWTQLILRLRVSAFCYLPLKSIYFCSSK